MAGHCYEVKFDQFLQFLPLYDGVFYDFDQQSILKENVVRTFVQAARASASSGGRTMSSAHGG